MIWAPALVLMTVLSPSVGPAQVASTYDEAACARPSPSDGGGVPDALAADVVGNCSEPAPVAAPAIIDCNDPGVSVWVGEMIGSCDMPRPVSPTQVQPTAVRSGRNGPAARVCDGFTCSHDSTP